MKKILVNTLILSLCLLSANLTAAEISNYLVTFDTNLTKVTVKIHLERPVAKLKARKSSGDLFIEKARDCQTGNIITYKSQSLFPETSTRCLEYSMRLQQISESRLFKRQGQSIVTQVSEWLFLPRLGTTEKILVKVKHSPEYNLSVPWKEYKPTENEFLISASPQSGTGLIVIGKFYSQNIQHKGTTLRVAYLPGKKVDPSMIKEWLKTTVDNVSLVYGSFPNPNPQIIIVPYAKNFSRQKSPVPFGRVIRDYGESVQFFIDQRQSLKQFNQDWTATHEFSHLLLPYISWKNRWLSEGFASYYQNVLLARSGIYSEQRAWQKLYEGFMRGKRSAPELSPNSAAREGWGGNMKVYWSGAALFFVADQTLRRESNNTKSLDSTLKKLKHCCLPATRSWSGRQLMRKLDELSDSRVFTNLHAKYANSNQFVDFESEFAKLGISIRNGKVKLAQTSEFIQLRKRVMAAP